jgi:uncharacterized membrane protein
MEPLLILFLVALAGGFLTCTFVLPIIAWVRSRHIAELERRLTNLEAELRRLRRDVAQGAAPQETRVGVPDAIPVVESQEPSVSTGSPNLPSTRSRPSSPERPRKTSFGADAAGIEAWLGQRGLGWAAALLLLFAVAFFLKYAFDNEWIGPTGQLAAGVAVACALCGGGLHYHRKGWRVFSQIMTSAGVALLYLLTYSSFGYFNLVSQSSGSFFLVAVVVETVALSLIYNAEAIAIMAVLGGLLTPILLHTDIDRYSAFFVYLAVLNAGAALLAVIRPWSWPSLLALIGTQVLFWGWFHENYHPEKLSAVLAFQSFLFVLHLAACVGVNSFGRRISLLDLVRVVLNGGFAAAAAYVLLDDDYHVWMGTLAIGFGIVHALAAWAVQEKRERLPQLSFVTISMAIAFAAAAVPLQAHAAWIAVGWAAQGVALWWFGMRIRAETLRSMGALLLAFALGRLVFVDTPYYTRAPFVPLFNAYGLAATTTAACIIAAALVTRRWLGRLGPVDRPAALAAGFAGIGLVWLILSVETYGYFVAQGASAADSGHMERLAETALSACWAIYAIVLLAIGFRFRSNPIRWAALGLFFVTVLKVIFLDMADLPGLYRVLAFLVLAVMMGIGAWAYQKFQRPQQPVEVEVNDRA